MVHYNKYMAFRNIWIGSSKFTKGRKNVKVFIVHKLQVVLD